MPAFESMIGDASHGPRDTRSRALSIGVIVALLGSAPGLRAQSAPTSDKAASKPAVVEKKAVADLEPFDLSYVPARARVILACRPSAILRREDMKRYVEAMQDLPSRILAEEADLPIPIKLGSIEQVTLGLAAPPGIEGEGQKPYCLSVRFAKDVDWQGPVKGYLAKTNVDWVKVSFEGKMYHKLRSPKAQPGEIDYRDTCVYFPDDHTFVLANEDFLRSLMRRPAAVLPELARGDGWQEVSRGLIAFASAQDGLEDEPDLFSGLVMDLFMNIVPTRSNNPRRLSCGIDGDETLKTRISEVLGDGKRASAIALENADHIAKIKFIVGLGSSDAEADDDKAGRFIFRCMQEQANRCQVCSTGRKVDTVARCKVRLAELVEVFGGDPDVKALPGDLKTTPGQDHKEAKR